jgi:hypothetical protein
MSGATAVDVAGMSSPAGGAFSTAADLVAFVKAVADGKLLPVEAIRARVPPDAARSPGMRIGGAGAPQAAGTAPPPGPGPAQPPAAGPGARETIPGLGFAAGDAALTFGGGAPGVNAAVGLFPGFEWTVVVLSTRDPPSAQMLAARVSRWLTATTC